MEKWTEVGEGLPKNNTTVVAIYLEPFMRQMTIMIKEKVGFLRRITKGLKM